MYKTVSIVIPVYKYLDKVERCLDSFMMQTYNNLELLLVCQNTDVEVVNNIAKKYTKMDITIILANDKKGVSAYRNLGIEQSKGEYITFVDCDDYVIESYVETLVKLLEDSDGLAMCNYMYTHDYDSRIEKFQMSDKSFQVEGLLGQMFGSGLDQYYGHVWNKLFDANLIREKNIRFDERIQLNEDRLFVVTYLLELDRGSKIKYCANTLYCYCQHENSVTARFFRRKFDEEMCISEIMAFAECE